MVDAPVNLSRLTTDFGDDRKFLEEIYTIYMKEGSERTDLLREAIEKGDFFACSEYGHAMKGASANVGAIGVEAVASQIEAISKNSDLESVKNLFGQLEQEFAKAKAFLTEYIASLKV